MASSSLEHGKQHLKESPSGTPTVGQPEKVPGLQEFLEGLNEMIAEVGGEDRSTDLGDGGTSPARTGTGASPLPSPRDLAIANLPQQQIMQQKLEAHIKAEVKHLRKQANTIARLRRPGAAYRLNQLYSRIRRLNALLAELLEASYEVMKRLFIRIFVDRQAIL